MPYFPAVLCSGVEHESERRISYCSSSGAEEAEKKRLARLRSIGSVSLHTLPLHPLLGHAATVSRQQLTVHVYENYSGSRRVRRGVQDLRGQLGERHASWQFRW